MLAPSKTSQQAGWCQVEEVLGFGVWTAPPQRFRAQHFVEAKPEVLLLWAAPCGGTFSNNEDEKES